MASVDAMVKKRSNGMSLKDLGYIDSGLDDNWQACGKGINGSFHGLDGVPLINYDRFPDMKNMTDYGKSKGIKMGWYGNNCICSESVGNNKAFKPTDKTGM